MEDQQLWQDGVRLLERLFNDIHPAKKHQLTELLADYRRVKGSLAAIALGVDSDTTCSDCQGQCCLNGKYRMNLLDVLSHSADGKTVLPDFLQRPLCPYGTRLGCTMEPGFRPADCITFICDAIDMRLPISARNDLNVYENAIRECQQKASRLLGLPITTPILLWAEKYHTDNQSILKEALS
ncbi:MAG: hypothetical protein PHD54_08180 [Desulfuromonadaceae bacterium]|nr:hypothetical protein [Desulfuromonadaceae bacterium]